VPKVVVKINSFDMKDTKLYFCEVILLLLTAITAAIVSAKVLVDYNNKAYSQTILDQSMNLKYNMFVSQYILDL
jgi:hypothetical protein